MTKAAQKEMAKGKIESKIHSMNMAQDLLCLEFYESEISAMLRLVWRLEIITKEERLELEEIALDEYLRTRDTLRAKEGGTAA